VRCIPFRAHDRSSLAYARMADDDLDHSISLALQQVGCPSITEQRACIKSVYDGKDVFLWLPTGFGKFLCYEVLPFVLGRKLNRKYCLMIVVSPMVSLMTDQVQSLSQSSVPSYHMELE
jgi:ATP-dependent DNA helicase RecQ